MADGTKISLLNELDAVPAVGDWIPLADVSDTSMSDSGTTKKINADRFLYTTGTANQLAANLDVNSKNLTNAGTISSSVLQVTTAATVNNSFNVSGGLGLTNMLGYNIYMNRPGANYLWATGVGGFWSIGVNGNTIGTDEAAMIIAANKNITAYANFNANSVGTDWTGLTYNTGWGDYGSGYQPGQFKRVGDMVFFRGMVARTSGSAAAIATMPPGFRCYDDEIIACTTNSGAGAIGTSAAAILNWLSGGVTWISLSGICYSTVA